MAVAAISRISTIQKLLLGWYQIHARDLPWRGIDDPYLVWISEVMLQQTRVETVIPYFHAWKEKFPTLEDTAGAEMDDLLKIWEGLGYYRRVHNIKKAAEIVQKEFAGQFPKSTTALKELPGIGEYIAGAISSIAFGADAAALDANGIRVIARLEKFREIVSKVANKKRLNNKLEAFLPHGRAGDFNQALMDLGSSICLPKIPMCKVCPLESVCLALEDGSQFEIPVLKPRMQIPTVAVVAAIIKNQEGCVLIAKRPADGLLGGLWEFPGGKLEEGESKQEALVREIMEELGTSILVGKSFGKYRHAYTHFKVEVEAFWSHISTGRPTAIQPSALSFEKIEDLIKFPMGKVDRQIANDLMIASEGVEKIDKI